MKKATQRIISLVICVLMLFGIAPLNGIAELDFSTLNIFAGLNFSGLKLPDASLFETKATAESITSGTCGNNLIWEFDEETQALVIRGTGTMTGYNVQSVGTTSAPWGNKDVRTVLISEGVTSIGYNAFYGCKSLESITIPDSVESLEYSCFYNCSQLERVSIPRNVTNIGVDAFYNCSELDYILVDSNNVKYKSEGNCLLDTDNKTLIFGTNNSIIPSDGSVVKIGNHAFSGRSRLETITLPNGISSIGNSAFSGCSMLTSIYIPDSVTNIGIYAFSNCTELRNVILPNSLTKINSYVFSNCISLDNVYIPDNVSSISRDAYSGCSSIETINVSNNNLYYHSDSNCLIETSSKTLIRGCKNSIIPNDGSVKKIEALAFNKCEGLTQITIPLGVTSIYDETFSYCGDLYEVVLPEGIQKIGRDAFRNCNKLESINLPTGIIEIGHYAFLNCYSLRHIVFPDTVTKIGISAFAGCSRLEQIIIPDSVTYVGSEAFRGCSSLSSVYFPDSITIIYERLFNGCSNLKTAGPVGSGCNFESDRLLNSTLLNSLSSLESIIIPYGVTTIIPMSAFARLKNITLPDSVISISENAFYNCAYIETIDIPNSVTSIGENAFYHVANIRYSDKMTATGSPWGAKTVDAYIENGLVYYDDTKAVLTGCLPQAADSIGRVTVPATVAEVSDYAFSGCDNVTSVTFSSDEIIDFSSTCFADCDSLQTISSPNTDSDGITYMLDEAYNYHIASNRSPVRRAAAKSRASEDTGIDFTEMNGILFCNRKKSGEYQVPERIRYICENAFANCTGLTINLDNCNLKKIGKNAFFNSGNYNKWNNSGLFTIGNYILSAPSTLASLTVASSCLCIADSAFENCDSLESVSFSGNGTYIGKNAFEGTPYIENEENWENGALYIGGQLVKAKADLSGTFAVESDISSIADGAFANCTGITSVTIPETVTQIGDNAFEYCYNLESVTLGGVETIGDYAFRDCVKLEGVSIPAGVEKIGDYAFINCYSLKAFSVDPENANYKSADGVLFSKNGASLIQYPAGKANIEEYNVDALDECVRIESLAFRNCKNIENVIASVKNKENPDGTIVLGYRNPFAKSTVLFNNGYVIIQDTCLRGWNDDTSADFTVPDGIKAIGANAFEGKANLTSITFNEGLEEIGDSAFFGCTGLTDIIFPASLREIGNSAFENCENLSSVEFSLNDGGSNTNLSEIGICAFAGCADNTVFINRDRLDKLGDNVGNCAFGHEGIVNEYVRHENLPTCTEPGIDSVIKYCEVCGAEHTVIDTKETVEPLGHSFTNYVYNNDATSEKDGTETAKCDRCNETDTRTVEGSKDLANYDVALKYADDNSALTITATNKDDPGVIVTQTTQAETTEIEPTCTEPGSITYKYTFTGILAPLSTEKTVKGKSELGHSFTNYIYNNDATIEKDGHETAKCDRCDETDTRVKPGTRITASQAVIKTGESKKVDYRAKVTITVEADNVPEGYFLAIYEGNKPLKRGTNKSVSYTIDEMTEEKTFTVKVIDDKGNVQTGTGDKPLQKEIEVPGVYGE